MAPLLRRAQRPRPGCWRHPGRARARTADGEERCASCDGSGADPAANPGCHPRPGPQHRPVCGVDEAEGQGPECIGGGTGQRARQQARLKGPQRMPDLAERRSRHHRRLHHPDRADVLHVPPFAADPAPAGRAAATRPRAAWSSTPTASSAAMPAASTPGGGCGFTSWLALLSALRVKAGMMRPPMRPSRARATQSESNPPCSKVPFHHSTATMKCARASCGSQSTDQWSNGVKRRHRRTVPRHQPDVNPAGR